jgi:hypothetical protein
LNASVARLLGRWQASRWRWRLGAWLPAALAVALGAGLFATYQARFAGRAEVTERALAERRSELADLAAERRLREERLAAVARTHADLADFYETRLATESRRLTRMIAEVKDLARRSGLVPQSINYPQESLEDFGLRRRSFQFTVEGTYPDLRKLVNLLELSPSFLTLEGVRLSGGGRGAQLAIDLALSTLFAAGEAEPGGAAAAPAPAAPAPAAPAGGPASGEGAAG